MSVLLASGVVMGMSTLVVDVGLIYVEREQLQSGADAAAMGVAKHCAIDPGTCASQAAATAQRYANANASDRISGVTVICGTGRGLSVCPAPSGTLSACLSTPPAGLPYVEVRTTTEIPDGTRLLPPTFAQAMVGGDSAGTQISACARAAWGPPNDATGLAIGVSLCTWQAMTSRGDVLPTDEHAIYLHDPHVVDPDSAQCPKGPGGTTAPGGFGFLAADADTCLATGSAPRKQTGLPGNISHGCETPMAEHRTSHEPILLPIYDDVTEGGSNTSYHVIGFAAFVVTGWRLSGTSMASNVAQGSTAPAPAPDYCSAPDRCVYGYFTSITFTTGSRGGGTNYGVSIVRIAG